MRRTRCRYLADQSIVIIHCLRRSVPKSPSHRIRMHSIQYRICFLKKYSLGQCGQTEWERVASCSGWIASTHAEYKRSRFENRFSTARPFEQRFGYHSIRTSNPKLPANCFRFALPYEWELAFVTNRIALARTFGGH